MKVTIFCKELWSPLSLNNIVQFTLRFQGTLLNTRSVAAKNLWENLACSHSKTSAFFKKSGFWRANLFYGALRQFRVTSAHIFGNIRWLKNSTYWVFITTTLKKERVPSQTSAMYPSCFKVCFIQLQLHQTHFWPSVQYSHSFDSSKKGWIVLKQEF